MLMSLCTWGCRVLAVARSLLPSEEGGLKLGHVHPREPQLCLILPWR